ncbi:hypothetical protein ACFQX6_12305 [Streptosporangium lutulentum]
MRIEIKVSDDLNLRPATPVGQKASAAADDPYLHGGGILASGTTGTIFNCTSAFNRAWDRLERIDMSHLLTRKPQSEWPSFAAGPFPYW